MPFDGGWTVLDRMRQGKQVVVHGDGTSLWTLTHHEDFARGFVPLLGHPRAIGEAFHITSDDVADLEPDRRSARPPPRAWRRSIVHVPSDAIAAADPEWGAGLLGDKAHSMVFDNTKLRASCPDFVATIPFEQGAREIVAWYDEDPARQVVDERLDEVMDDLVARLPGLTALARAGAMPPGRRRPGSRPMWTVASRWLRPCGSVLMVASARLGLTLLDVDPAAPVRTRSRPRRRPAPGGMRPAGRPGRAARRRAGRAGPRWR